MSETLVDPNGESRRRDRLPGPAGRPSIKVIARGLTVGAIIVLAGFIVAEAHGLWREWTQLQTEIGGAHDSQLIGYHDIAPIASYAEGPDDWFHQEGDQSLLWARWQAGVGHQWFHFRAGDMDRSRLARPPTISISRAIDYPLIETGDGDIWRRIPPESPVVGHTLLGLECVYPVLVLGKVQVVNDVVHDHPFLILDNLFASADRAYSIFDANLNGRRVTMAATGYFYGGKLLLYDRGTQSLWCEDTENLTAVAGKHKGMKLARVAHPTPVAWQTWLSQNHKGRLLVGADRSHGVPRE